jgi:hypothetical protein
LAKASAGRTLNGSALWEESAVNRTVRDVGLWLVVILSVPAIIIGLFAVNGYLLRP